jgi:hypothetical protein
VRIAREGGFPIPVPEFGDRHPYQDEQAAYASIRDLGNAPWGAERTQWPPQRGERAAGGISAARGMEGAS